MTQAKVWKILPVRLALLDLSAEYLQGRHALDAVVQPALAVGEACAGVDEGRSSQSVLAVAAGLEVGDQLPNPRGV